MSIISRIHGYYSCWRTTIGEHSNKNQICVVNPIESLVKLGIKAGLLQELNTSGCHGNVGIQLVWNIFCRIHISNRGFCGGGICSNFDLVTESRPMRTLTHEVKLSFPRCIEAIAYLPSSLHASRHLRELHRRISSSMLHWRIPPQASLLSHEKRSVQALTLSAPLLKIRNAQIK
jgi:hypothetical protein